ncbi:MAG: gluconate 2-dehydrogenase subunit 3 family protein [Verrucomicrobia bacterium]|nr:gluconate 2-dehydrogenase subunit 3 family protein [Verrucomicrobiota bacterium]
MNPTVSSPAQPNHDAATMGRREAIKRAAMFLGVAISPSLLSGALQAQTGGGAGAGAKPVYLTAKQFATAGAVAERILPRTDTPGALDVGVPAFIDLMYGKFLSEGDRQTFAAGLADVERASAAAHRADFAALPAEQQDSLLRKIATGSAREKAFFRQIKEVTVLGYFTSETVGKTVLHYDPVPGRFDACVPLSEVGNKAWTK